MKNNMPPNWQPPAPAWQAQWVDHQDLRVAYFAIQADQPDLLELWCNDCFELNDDPQCPRPLLLERGHFLDSVEQSNFLIVSYWREDDYQRWWANANISWYKMTRANNIGFWRETICLPLDNFETLLSSPDVHGIASFSDSLEGPILEHGYPGGMRDRIKSCTLKDVRSNTKPEAELNSEQAIIRIVAPENLCMIRSGQDWGHCDVEQARDYLENVHPVLQVGMNYLRDKGDECDCYSMRLVDVLDDSWGETKQTFGLGFAKDIFVFENWAKSHPTHLDIFGKFMTMAERYGEKLQLQLWHEVAVCSGSAGEFEYIQCHAKTGILPFAHYE